MVTINAQVVRDTTAGLYRVTGDITATVDIPGELFVFDTVTAEFSRVATAPDVSSYPIDRATAQTNNQPYYRQDVVVRTFTSLSDAQAFATSIQPRLKSLAKEYQTAVDAFLGTTDYVITSG